jgi:chromosome segregation ATPase
MLDSDGELQIKDLLIKLDVLTYGIIKERKKAQSYLVRINELQNSLQTKENEVTELTKLKFNLQSKLSLELSKKSQPKKSDGYFSSIMNKIRDKTIDQSYVVELEEKINQQNFEIKDLSQRLQESQENFDQQKIQFQTMITLQNQEMSKLKKSLEEEKKSVRVVEKVKPVEDNESKEKLRIMVVEFNRERDKYERKIKELNDELDLEKKSRDEIKKLNAKIEEMQAEIELKKMENKVMKDQASKADKELIKAKIEIQDSKLSERFFQVERIKDGIMKNKKIMILVFRYIRPKNKEKGRCEIVFKQQKHGETTKEEVVNLLDFNSFKVNDKKKDIYDLSFMVS